MFNLNISKAMDDWQIVALCYIGGCLATFILGIIVGKCLFHDNFAEIEEEVKEVLDEVEYEVGKHYTSTHLSEHEYVTILYIDDTTVLYKMWHRDGYLATIREMPLKDFKELFIHSKIIDNHDNR